MICPRDTYSSHLGLTWLSPTYLDRASIRIPSVIKEIFEKLLIEAVNGVIKSQQNKLWNAFPAETSGNLK